MSRDASTPLILWVCAAVCAHYVFAQGGGEVAKTHDDRMEIIRIASKVRERVRYSEQVFEVSTLQAEKAPDGVEPEAPPPPPKEKPEKKKLEEKKDDHLPEARKPEEKKKEEKKIAVAIVPDQPKPAPPPEMLKDRRIAVKQHAQKDQTDNPNARFIADQANHVDQETVATQTSHSQDDPNPTPGGNHAGPKDRVGDGDKTKIADDEDRAGEKNKGPGDKGTEFEVKHVAPPKEEVTKIAAAARPPPAAGDGKPAAAMANRPMPQEAPGGPGPGAPEVMEAPGATGNWSFNPIRPGAGTGTAPQAGPGRTVNPAQSTGNPRTAWLGLGGRAGPGQVNLNLSTETVVAAVGHDQLRREREADGERRRSQHRGSWTASGFERWRTAIENYVSTVKPGNQTALNTAQSPFGSYLVLIHNRIHPIFADTFLASLDNLPKTHPLNDPKLITKLEIVLSKEGRLTKMGVVRTSGVTAFDIAALDSVQRASPFGPAPSAIISPDGNVYLHWEFHRDEVFACSTINASPFILNVPPPPRRRRSRRRLAHLRPVRGSVAFRSKAPARAGTARSR